jgi:hypothetical protein
MKMNNAEQRRNVRIAAMADLDLLDLVIGDAETTSDERTTFMNMRADIRGGRSCLSRKQRAWAEEVARRVTPLRAEEAPRGREVLPAPVLRNPLPKKPPARRAVD